jgi:hypothetical protein
MLIARGWDRDSLDILSDDIAQPYGVDHKISNRAIIVDACSLSGSVIVVLECAIRGQNTQKFVVGRPGEAIRPR